MITKTKSPFDEKSNYISRDTIKLQKQFHDIRYPTNYNVSFE